MGNTVRYAMSSVLEFERNGLRKPVPRQITPPEPSTPDIAQNMTVRDVVASLRAGGDWPSRTVENQS